MNCRAWPFIELWEFSIEHLQRIRHANTAQGISTLTPPVTWSRLICDLHASTTHSVIHITLWVVLVHPPGNFWQGVLPIYSVRETLWNFIGHSVLLGESFHRDWTSICLTLSIHNIHSIWNNIGQFGPTGNEANRTDHIFVLPVRRSDEFWRTLDITLSLFVKHVLYTLKNDSICYGLVHRLSTLKLLLFMASKEWTMSLQNLSGYVWRVLQRYNQYKKNRYL